MKLNSEIGLIWLSRQFKSGELSYSEIYELITKWNNGTPLSCATIYKALNKLMEMTYLVKIKRGTYYYESYNSSIIEGLITEHFKSLLNTSIEPDQYDHLISTGNINRVRLSTLEHILEVYYSIIKYKGDWSAVKSVFKKSTGQYLNEQRLNKYNGILFPLMSCYPFEWITNDRLCYKDGTNSTIDRLPLIIKKLIDNHKSSRKADSMKEQLMLEDQLMMTKSKFIDLVITTGFCIYKHPGITRMRLIKALSDNHGNNVSERLLDKLLLKLDTMVGDHKFTNQLFIDKYEDVLKSFDPSRLKIELVMLIKASVDIKSELSYDELITTTVDNHNLVNLITKNNSELDKFLKKMYSHDLGKIIYPRSLNDSYYNEWITYRDSF